MIYDKGARTITWENVLEKLYIHMQQNEVVPLPKIQKITQNRSKTSVWFSSVTQSCPTLCNPMNRSMPGLPVRHQLPEFTQTHSHWVGDAIQSSHPLSSPSPHAPNLSQHQGLFKWVSSSHPAYWSLFIPKPGLYYQLCEIRFEYSVG